MTSTQSIMRELQSVFKSNFAQMQEWILAQYKNDIPPILCSVDIRNASFKVCHVDANLFPAGFAHLSSEALQKSSQHFKSFISTHYPECRKILLVPEKFTRNKHYNESVLRICNFIEHAGYQVKKSHIESIGKNVHNNIMIGDWKPDLIMLNNDLTDGVPKVLENCRQEIIPSPQMGWSHRSKYTHFEIYNNLVDEFAKAFSINPWFLSIVTQQCSNINFREKSGFECVAIKIEKIIHKISTQYKEYGIDNRPSVFIKADKGTYGMGIMTASSGDEFLNMNKKIRNKMNQIKSGVKSTQVIIQECIPSAIEHNGHPAEVIGYNVGGHCAGSIVRWNPQRCAQSNLNSAGMQLEPYHDNPIHTIISMLACLATSKELAF